MPREISSRTIDDKHRRKIAEISGQNVHQCFQCGTCASSCPMGDHLDATPRKLMILIQFGQSESLETLNTAWVCASCHTCVVRCPRGLDIAAIMEAVRQVTLRTNVNRVEPDKLQPEKIAEMPQIAMVSAFRKLTS